MTPDQLRALADALEPMARAPRFEDFDVPGFCAWVRACADAQPVAWIGPSRPKIDGADYRVLRQDYDASHGYGWSRDTAKANGFLPLYTHPAPAPSQAEQPIDLDAVAMQQMRQAAAESTWLPAEYSGNDWINDVCRWLRDGPPQAEPIDPHMIVADDRFPDEQAEPKRDWSVIDAAIREYLDDYELIGEDDAGADAYYTPTERELYLIYDAINGLLADENFMRLIAPHPAPAPQSAPQEK